MHAGKRHLLQIGAIVTGRLQAVQREFGGDVAGGNVAATRARAASLEQIARQKLHMRADPLRIDALQRGGHGGIEPECGGGIGRPTGIREQCGVRAQAGRQGEAGGAASKKNHVLQSPG